MVVMSNKVLVIGHRPGPRPGRLGSKLGARGWHLDLRCPLAGDPLPGELHHHGAIVVLGGPMSANDDLPSIRAELQLIERALADGLPFLGICLGAQLLARALGAKVAPHPDGHAEIGYYPVRATAVGGELFAMGHHVYQWHMEGFEQPAGTELLATGEVFPNQAIRFADHAYGIQFHPEVTPEIMEAWLEDSPERLSLPGAQCARSQREHQRIHHQPLGLWLDRFLDQWLPNTSLGSGCQLPVPVA